MRTTAPLEAQLWQSSTNAGDWKEEEEIRIVPREEEQEEAWNEKGSVVYSC